MSEAATRDGRLRWARPGSGHDRGVRLALLVLPLLIGALVAVLVVAPLIGRREVSFVLAKDKVATAKERMRVDRALYRGEDDQGRPFSVEAGSAVQASSRDPLVRLSDMSARLALSEGPAVLRAPTGGYDMTARQMRVDGPLLFESADGYRLTTRDVAVDLGTQRLASEKPVEGRIPLGTFSADRLKADLEARTVTLEGRARLRIVQGAARGR